LYIEAVHSHKHT